MSLAIATTSVPAVMMSSAAGAVTVANISASTLKGASVILAEGDSTTGTIPEGATSLTFTIKSDYAGSFSYGLGVSTSSTGYWAEHTATGEWATKGAGYSVSLVKGDNEITVELPDDVTTGTGSKYEFRSYYSRYWDSASTASDKMEAFDVTLTSVSAGSGTGTNPGSGELDDSEVTHNNKQSGDWGFTDNKDGTATIWTTYTKQLDGLEDILTQGYDEEYYADHPDEMAEPGYPINSKKVSYGELGITDLTGITIESVTATIESDTEMSTFMYGGGLNVEVGSAADTEYAKQVAGIEGKESAGYWYNDMGAEEVEKYEAAGVEFGIEPANGYTVKNAGTYYEAYWEVPADVQPYVSTLANDGISFQYWYGVTSDASGEETPLESVKLTSIAVTYTKTVTVPYTDSVKKSIGETVEFADETANNIKVPYADLGIDESKNVYAIRFDVSANSDIKKLVYNFGTSTSDEASGYWYQDEASYVKLNAGDSAELMWIIPDKIAGKTANTNIIGKDGEVYFGYYYGEADALSIDNIEVYYDEPVTTTTTTTTTSTTTTTTSTTTTTTTTTKATTTTTTTTTTPPVTTTTAPKVTLYGDVNEDGSVDISDATLIMQFLIDGSLEISPVGKLNGDVSNNGDGITSADALAIQRYLANLIDTLPES